MTTEQLTPEQQFRAGVKDFWPGYADRTNLWPIYESLKKYPADLVFHAMRRHRQQFPDDTKPVWQVIRKELGIHWAQKREDKERLRASDEVEYDAKRRVCAQRVLADEFNDDERDEAWEAFIATGPSKLVQDTYRRMGIDQWAAHVLEKVKPGRLAEVMKEEDEEE